jgi:tetratricopeptide (TPR) repeat protein
LAEATAETNHCLEISPAANDCIADRMEIHARFGLCEEMTEDAKRIIANDPNDWSTHRALATALLAQGRSTTTVRTALDRGWDKAPSSTKERWIRFDDIHFALLEGRFDDAERAFLEWKPQEDKNPFDDVHRALAQDLVELYEVMAKPKEAAKIADKYLSTREVWIRGFVRSIWDDPTIWFLKKKLDAGMISRSAYQTDRATWVEMWEDRLSPDMKNIAWFQAYALPAETAEDAKEALAIHSELKPLEYYRKRPTSLHNALGNVYLLAGRAADALPHLSAAAKDCRLLYQPIENTLTHYRLAKAREALGDQPGACESYGVVLQRWSKSRPILALVEDARIHSQKLACKAR